MEKVISNRESFKRYYYLRNAALVLVAIYLVVLALGVPLTGNWHNLIGNLAITALVVLVIYEQLNQPALIEIEKEKDVLRLSLFIPVTPFFFRYSKDREKEFIITEGAILSYEIMRSGFLNFRKIRFVLSDAATASVVTTPYLDFTWASPEDIARLNRLV